MKENRALIVVDMLYDFIDGSLACQEAEKAVSATLAFIEQKRPYPILFIRDHHPANHSSFAEYGGPWPPHCVQGTPGADIHESFLPYVEEELCFYKGEDPATEQYSGFEGLNRAGQSLEEVLRLLENDKVLVCGIATEYCVRNTAQDLASAGFKVTVLKDCLAYVDPQGHKDALKAMKAQGIRVV